MKCPKSDVRECINRVIASVNLQEGILWIVCLSVCCCFYTYICSAEVAKWNERFSTPFTLIQSMGCIICYHVTA